MNTHRTSKSTTMLRVGALSGAAVLLALLGMPPVLAAGTDSGSGDVKVLNTETVRVYLSASGEVQSKRVYEQLVLTGHGKVDIANPVSTDGLRNLDGFGGLTVKDGNQIARTDVDGTRNYRSVSNFDGALPVSVTPSYELDGKSVSPGDVVGARGRLQVQFKVVNKTTRPQDVSFDDGSGHAVTKSVEVPVPMVGSLTTTAPKNFTDVTAGGANSAGDGEGGTRLSYTMTLFPPLGSDTAVFGYSADITDGVVPKVEVSLVPVDPLASPTFKSAAGSYKGGADTGAQLVAGAGEIDTNLLKLRDGAASLLAGLLKLSTGADQLTDGLTNDAAPGARKLAAGAGQLDAGATKLHRGTADALAGSQKLQSGLGQISGGLGQLADQLPAAGPGIQKLIAGVDQLVAGFGAVGSTGTLIDGLNQINAGAGSLKAGLSGQIAPGVGQAKGGVDQVRSGLNEAIKAGGSIDQLIGGLQAVLGADCGPGCAQIINQGILPGAQQSKADLQAASGGLGQVSGGLQQVLDGLNGQIIPGLAGIEAGSGKALDGARSLKAGNQQVRSGLVTLKGRLAEAISGILKLNTGANAAVAGSGDLSTGLGQLEAGSGKLASGTGELSTGAGTLADGLGTAGDGSGQIADGLKQAAGGAPQLVDGAGRISTEGMGQLKRAGADTAQSYGEMYAVIKAGADRAQTSAMAFGAPAGAEGLTAYSFTITGDDGEAGRNWTRGIAALFLLGLSGGAVALRRRMAA